MSYFSGQWPSGHLKLTGMVVSALLVSACGTPTTSSSSSANVSSSVAVSSKSSSSSSSSSPVVGQDYDHCTDGGFQPHYANGQISDGGYAHVQNNETDLSVDPNVYTYMYKNGWQDAHVLWHQARTCSNFGGGFASGGLPSACTFTDIIPKGANDCTGDKAGVDFFSGHRTMMYQLRELWPDHQEQFTGWDTFPTKEEDYPPALRGYFNQWSAEILAAAEIADNIEQHLDMFATEGELGSWISCAMLPNGGGPSFSIAKNLHFALHGNGVPTRNQKHAVNNNPVNIDSYLFWKLHGWIDNVWEKYRIAKGKTRDDADYKAEMLEQCREMDAWREIGMETRGDAGHPNQDEGFVPLPNETGFFHDVIAPALEKARCTTCHGAGFEQTGGLRLGYQVTSSEVVDGLLTKPSAHAQGYRLVVPGKPEESWLYLKATGLSTTSGATCVGVGGCQSEMSGLTDEDLNNLREWILNGAERPILLN